MPTVTYKNQPGIHKTRGAVPLAGTKHVYTVKKVLWPAEVEDFISTLLLPRTLHVCCGKSSLGDVRLDNDPANEPDLLGDAVELLEGMYDDAFDTVLCDPPYNGSFDWNHRLLKEMARVASARIVFQHWFIPANPFGEYKKANEKFQMTELSMAHTNAYAWQGRSYFGRAQIISVFDNHGALE